MDATTTGRAAKLPQLTSRAGPRGGDGWNARLREELTALIVAVTANRAADRDWFTLTCDDAGTRWTGACWAFYANLRYQFDVVVTLPVSYPTAPPSVALPALVGRTAKMYRDGSICQTVHFEPAWARHAPAWGVAHALALGLGPWLAAELPDLVARGVVAEFVQ
ncbi:hypothetical protein BU14_0535s0009 [Porphyra umbilicalis]|uniref:Ubiquitin-fold modifier-conjugating enzyme 1 n=1 Tax=Porphyra umbilicalis TaxID=2786 RepID=A0A1X6NS40_PORUM|nr:hypothetical protein BU14_0535s0009 [Porphyra umbilicalis]|eukprot:OSX71431.1 hypothetical protein BU14_0535s0009 [Porphyra umbilicalis]